MGMELIGAAGMTYELKQTYDRTLLSTAEVELVYLNYGQKKDIPARGGKSIEFRRFEQLPYYTGSYALTEGTPPAYALQATISSVPATISQYGAYTQISDVLDTQGFDPVIDEYSVRFGEHMGLVMDSVGRDVIVAGTTVQYASTAATRTGASGVGSGMYLNSAELTEARRTLRRNSAKPVDGNKYIAIIHPDNTKDLFDDADISQAFKDAAPRDDKHPLFTGMVGDYMGIRFIETTNCKIWTSLGLSGADVYGVMLLGKEAYGITKLTALQSKLIVHARGTGGHTDPLEQYSTIGWKASLAVVRLNENWMVRVECNASYHTAA